MFHGHHKRNALVATVAGCFALAGLAAAQSQPATSGQSQPMTPAQSQTSGSNPPSQMSTMAPSKSDTAVSAFQKLDATKVGYMTKEQATKLNGFDFTRADKNNDGKLDRDEFNAAWGVYSGKPQG
jgi:hypothetical protein